MTPLWNIGDRIQNRWEVHHIRRGRMGLVYIVYDHETHLPYAVKTLQNELVTRDAAIIDRFIQAAQAWCRVEPHAHVTQAHTVEIVEAQPLLWMDYVSGGDLRDWIGIPRLTKDMPQVVRFALQVCDAMMHALAGGIAAHRDIKPSNCLITPDGHLKVTDLQCAAVLDGVAAALDEAAEPAVHRLHIGPHGVAGTCTHMAPELFDDPNQAGEQSDIYAFGVLLFQMATGALPFTGQTWQECAHLHRTQPIPQLPSPADVFGSLTDACLAKHPDHRLRDFQQVREQLSTLYTKLTSAPAPPPIVDLELEVVQYNNAGTGLAVLGRHQDALACYDQALTLNSRHALSWVHRGTALEALGQTEDALTCCNHALQLDPNNEMALVVKGMMLGAGGRPEEARTHCERALKINPRNEQAWVNMGATLDALGRPMAALGCYNNALALNPRNEAAWFNAGVVLGDQGRHEDARRCCERVLSLNPRHEQAWVNYGLTLAELERPEEALTCFERALALNPNLDQAWFNQGVTLVNAFERYADALRCFEAAERLGYAPAAEGVALCQQALK